MVREFLRASPISSVIALLVDGGLTNFSRYELTECTLVVKRNGFAAVHQ